MKQIVSEREKKPFGKLTDLEKRVGIRDVQGIAGKTDS